MQAVVEQLWTELDGPRLREAESESDVRCGLLKLGEALADRWRVSDDVGFKRLVIQESAHFPWLAQHQQPTAAQAMARLSAWIAARTAEGRLRCEKPEQAAHQFMSLLMGQLYWPRVEGYDDTALANSTDVIVEAVDMFMARYAP